VKVYSYQERINSGVCTRCGVNPPHWGIKQCDPCRRKDSERHRKGADPQFRRHCGICKQPGHDIRTCTALFVEDSGSHDDGVAAEQVRVAEAITRHDCANRPGCLLDAWGCNRAVLDCRGCDRYEYAPIDATTVLAARWLLSSLRGA